MPNHKTKPRASRSVFVEGQVPLSERLGSRRYRRVWDLQCGDSLPGLTHRTSEEQETEYIHITEGNNAI